MSVVESHSLNVIGSVVWVEPVNAAVDAVLVVGVVAVEEVTVEPEVEAVELWEVSGRALVTSKGPPS